MQQRASHPPYLHYILPVSRIDSPPTARDAVLLPKPFLRWFADKGWHPRAHQLELLSRVQGGESMLLIAPTGAGKTLAGFLPSLVVAHRARQAQARLCLYRHPHALHLAAQGAGRRYRAQSDEARRRHGPADPHRKPHRRHARLKTPAPEAQSAGHPADDAGTGGAADCQWRGGALLQGSEICRAGRAAFAGHLQARPPAGAWPVTPAPACARHADHRPVCHCCRPDGPAALARAAGAGCRQSRRADHGERRRQA